MNKRMEKLIQSMNEANMDYLLISDPVSIDYLLDEMIHPGERLLALLVNKNGETKLFLNQLFHLSKDIDIDKIWFFDTDDSIQLIANEIEMKSTIGIDKIWPAKFLLPLIEKMPKATFLNGSVIIDSIRMVKDNNEKELMREASKINDRAVHDVIYSIAEDKTELDIANTLVDIYAKYGGEGNSFEPIIAYGPNGADGHHMPDGSVLKPGDSIVIDMGCRYKGYCSDMTRTVFYKEVSKKAEFVYNLVRKANESAIAMIKPGVKLCEIDATARNIISEAGYGENFNHRLGHFIGKEVHEYGDVSSQFDLEVKEGMIFSIEPGVYIEGELGVRIEDLVMVTKDGCEVLNSYTKDLIII